MQMIQLKIITVCSIIIIPLSFWQCAQSNQQYLAKFEDRKVTVDDFSQRYAKLMQLTNIRDNLQARTTVCNSLINEEILIYQAKRTGIDKSENFQREIEAITQQTLLDAYAEHTVQSRMQITDADIRKAFVKLKTQVSAKHLYARTKDDADELYAKLQVGYSFDDLAAMTFNDPLLSSNGGDLGYFTLGDMDPAFEEAAYSLKVGEISKPVKTNFGYSIIKVEDRKANPFITEYEYQKRKNKIELYLLTVQSKTAIKEFTSEIDQYLEFKFNEPALKLLFSKIQNTSEKDLFTPKDNQNDKSLTLADNGLQAPIVAFKGGEWNLETLLQLTGFTSGRQKQLITSEQRLKDYIKGLVVRKYLLEKAKEQNLQNNPEVKDVTAREIRNYTLKRMKEAITDTVTVPLAAIRRHYDKFSDQYYFPEEANVREILVESEEKATMLYEKLQNGADFSELARKHSVRKWAAERGGELGFAVVSKYCIIQSFNLVFCNRLE